MPRPLRKVLTYRDQTGASTAAHAEHWRGFTWTAGPVMVQALGPFGEIQVWGVSEGEARRVIAHAASIAGIDLTDPEEVEFRVATVNSSRLGRVATMRTASGPQGLKVAKRDGGSGPPQYID